jgi:hypothetical protein
LARLAQLADVAIVEARKRIQALAARPPPTLSLKWIERPERPAHDLLNLATRDADFLEHPIIKLGEGGNLPAVSQGFAELLEKASDAPSGGGERPGPVNSEVP